MSWTWYVLIGLGVLAVIVIGAIVYAVYLAKDAGDDYTPH